ncbi:MAG: hypothetical protein LBL35_07350 [Clostridiales bacterium]|nr:hypothetical protein [Clostridiales bacterium]
MVIYVAGDIDVGKSEYIERTRNENVIIKTCKYSFRKFTETMNLLNAFKENKSNNAIAKNFNAYALMDAENCVVVELDDFSQNKITEFRESVFSDPCVEFTTSRGKLVDDINVNPGNSISANGGGGSVGYRVKRSNVEGVLTAGHAANSTASGSNDVKMSNTVFAQCTSRRQSGSVDAAFCAITNTSYTPTNTLNGGTLSTTI